MPTIYLVRHGENPANLTREFSHRTVDYSLTPRGLLQAQQTAAHMRHLPISAVYASPLKRARETAQVIADALGLPVTIREAFREINVGALEGLPPTDEHWATHDGILRAWLAGQHDTSFPAGEDYLTLLARMRAGFEAVVRESRAGNSIIVGHGGIFTATIAQICANVDFQEMMQQWARNCSITEIEAQVAAGAVTATLRRWADHGHLSDGDA